MSLGAAHANVADFWEGGGQHYLRADLKGDNHARPPSLRNCGFVSRRKPPTIGFTREKSGNSLLVWDHSRLHTIVEYEGASPGPRRSHEPTDRSPGSACPPSVSPVAASSDLT